MTPSFIPPRPLRDIDRDLGRVLAHKVTTESGDHRWQAAMARINQLLDERLLATAEQLIREAA